MSTQHTTPIFVHHLTTTSQSHPLRNVFFQRFVNDDEDPVDKREASAKHIPEFSHICGLGIAYQKPDGLKIKTWECTEQNEKATLQEYFDLLQETMNTNGAVMVGHYLKDAFIPFLCRRALILGVKIPSCLQYVGKPDWERKYIEIDTRWRSGSYKNNPSLQIMSLSIGKDHIQFDDDEATTTEYIKVAMENNLDNIATIYTRIQSCYE